MTDLRSSDDLLAEANNQVVFMTAWADFTSALNASLGIGDVLHAASSILRQIFGFDQTIMVVVGPRGDLTAMRTLPERPDSVWRDFAWSAIIGSSRARWVTGLNSGATRTLTVASTS